MALLASPVVFRLGLRSFVSRQRVHPRNRRGDHWYFIGNAALAMTVLIAGLPYSGRLVYWVPAAIIAALPSGVRAWQYRA